MTNGALWRAGRRAIAFLRRDAFDDDLREELNAHLAIAADEYERAGMTPADARRMAAMKLGGRDAAVERHRDARGLPAVDVIARDVKYAWRGFRREPLVTLVSIVILALGIGANTAVFSIVNPMLLRPLPLPDADRLVWIANTGAGGTSGRTYRVDVFEELARNARSFESIAGYFAFFGFGGQTLTGRGDPERLHAVDVSPRFFEVLGIQPRRGRLFTADEHTNGGPRAAIVGHGLWQSRFGGDPSIVGRSITINGRSVTVVGLLPAGFDFASLFTPGVHVDLFLPADMEQFRPRGNTFALVGRLRPDVTVDDARAEMAALVTRLGNTRRDLGRFGATLTDLKSYVGGRMQRSLVVLWAAVGFVLLIVCANLANLLLARASARSREFAVRIALGAGRPRLVRQLLTEGILLAVCGAMLGVPLAYGLTGWLTSSATLNVPLLAFVKVDLAALAVTGIIAIATGLLFAMHPAIKVSARAPQFALRDHSRGAIDSPRHAWIRRTLVVSEIALAAILLVGAGLLGRSLVKLMDVELGFEPSRAIAARVELQEPITVPQLMAMRGDIVRRVRALPGVEGAGFSDALPLDRNRSWPVWIAGADERDPRRTNTFAYIVGQGYFQAMGIALHSGRDFNDLDQPVSSEPGAPRVAIINRTLARTLFPGINDPIGRSAVSGNIPFTVIGVVDDVRQSSLDETPASQLYLTMTQGGAINADLIVRTALDTESLLPQLRRTLGEVDSRLLATDIRPLTQLVDRAVSPRRFIVSLLGGFSLLAVVLASLGIYGVVSYGVSQRTAEIGVRMALGATAADVRRQVLGDTLRMALVGVAIGTAAALGLSRIIGTLLFGTSATDPLTFGLTVVLLTSVALVAGYLPAFRASRIDPMRALRAE
jgi:predicted permease